MREKHVVQVLAHNQSKWGDYVYNYGPPIHNPFIPSDWAWNVSCRSSHRLPWPPNRVYIADAVSYQAHCVVHAGWGGPLGWAATCANCGEGTWQSWTGSGSSTPPQEFHHSRPHGHRRQVPRAQRHCRCAFTRRYVTSEQSSPPAKRGWECIGITLIW